MIYRRGSIRKIHCSPEEKLCRKYNASRSTLRRALNMLKETGVLTRSRVMEPILSRSYLPSPYLISTRLLIRLKAAIF